MQIVPVSEWVDHRMALGLAICLLAGCGADDADRAGHESVDPRGDDGGPSTSPRATPYDSVHIRGTLQLGPGPEVPASAYASAPPLEGAEVCIHRDDETPCVMTGPDGSFDLFPVPAFSRLGITFAKPGFAPVLRPVFTGGDDMVFPPTAENFLHEDVGQYEERDAAGQGSIFFFAVGAASPGQPVFAAEVRVTVVSEPDVTVLYAAADGKLDPDLTSTEMGVGRVFLEPGEYRLAFEADTGPCIPLVGAYGWPGEEPNELRAPVFEGVETITVGALCQRAPPAAVLAPTGDSDGGVIGDAAID